MDVGAGAFTIGVGLSMLAAIALAVQSLAIRYGTINRPSAHALFVVLLVNISAIVPVTILLTDPLAELSLAAILAFAAAGLVGTTVGRAFHYEGIKRVGMSITEPIRASQPLHASVIAIVILGEVVSRRHLASMTAIVLGVGLITYEYSADRGGARSDQLWGLAFPLVAAVFYGVEPTLAKLGFDTGASVLTGLTIKTVAAFGAFSVYLRFTGGVPHLSEFDRVELPWLLFAGGANTVFLLGYYAALEIEPVSVVVPLVQASPLLALVLAIVFVRDDLELVTWRMGLAAAIVVIGAVGVTLFR